MIICSGSPWTLMAPCTVHTLLYPCSGGTLEATLPPHYKHDPFSAVLFHSTSDHSQPHPLTLSFWGPEPLGIPHLTGSLLVWFCHTFPPKCCVLSSSCPAPLASPGSAGWPRHTSAGRPWVTLAPSWSHVTLSPSVYLGISATRWTSPWTETRLCSPGKLVM